MASEEYTQAMAGMAENVRNLIDAELERRETLSKQEALTRSQEHDQALDELREKLQMQSEKAVVDAKKQAITEYKNKVASGSPFKSDKAVKKPTSYEEGSDIRAYVNSWNIYKDLLNLSDIIACQSFTTYLSATTQSRLQVLGVLDEKDWTKFTEGVIKALEAPKSSLALQHKLRNMKQKPSESLVDFSGRLLLTAGQAFGKHNDEEKDKALKGALCAGICNDTVAVEIIEHESWTFKESLEYALKKEISLSARKEMNEGQDGQEVAILKVDAGQSGSQNFRRDRRDRRDKPRKVNLVQNNGPQFNKKHDLNSYNSEDRRCYNCNLKGHIAANCKNRKVCFFCNKPGHEKKACFALQRSKAMEKPRGPPPQLPRYQPNQGSNFGPRPNQPVSNYNREGNNNVNAGPKN